MAKKPTLVKDSQGILLVANNRKARWDYEILDTYEAGMVLLGTEVKSLRSGRLSLGDSYAKIEGEEIFLLNLSISPYEGANPFNHEPERPRKLLLHRWQIRRLIGQTQQKGLTLVPLKLYFTRSIAKVEIALVKGKRQFDKRHDIAKRDAQRAVDRALKGRE
jgi:SsrA-binding protein